MIIIHVMGGLGNQLYQYAMYEKLRSLGREVKLDLYAYRDARGEDREWRELELERLDGLCYEVCSREERTAFLDSSMKLTARVRRKLSGRRSRQVDEDSAYMPEIFEMDDVYLYGFWSCDRYYTDIIPLLWEKIRFPESADPRNAAVMRAMRGQQSVSIHIRRKDYLTVADGRRYMGICTDDYYKSAVRLILDKVQDPVFYVFSDDPGYARAHYDGPDMHIIDWNTGRDSMYDMQLMSHCRYNICANSTFSMWGARLNRYDQKIMIRPLHHDNYEGMDAAQIQENWKGWVLIDANGRVC